MFLKDRKNAFTLVELTVVIGIIILLASIIMATLLSPREQGEQNACDANLKAINSAIKMYYNDNGCSPVVLTDLKGYGISAKNLICPAGHSYEDLYLNRDLYRPQDASFYNLAYFSGCPWHGRRSKAVVMLLDGTTIKGDIYQAVVSAVTGSVRVFVADRANKDDFTAASAGMKLAPGDIIETGESSTAALLFKDNSSLTLQPGTKMTLVQSFRDDRIASRCHTVVSLEGPAADDEDYEADYSHNSADPETYFEIATPALIAGIRGTTLTVRAYEVEVIDANVDRPVVVMDRKSKLMEKVEKGKKAGFYKDNRGKNQLVKGNLGQTLKQIFESLFR